MWKISNVSHDRTRSMQHRRAPKMTPEPVVAGRRLMLRQSVTITDAQYEAGKAHYREQEKHGVIHCEQVSVDGAPMQLSAPVPSLLEPTLHPSVAEEVLPPTPVEEPPAEVVEEVAEEAAPAPVEEKPTSIFEEVDKAPEPPPAREHHREDGGRRKRR